MKWMILLVVMFSAPAMAGGVTCGDPFRTENIGQIDKIQICVGINDCHYQEFESKIAAFEPPQAPESIERQNVSIKSLFAD